MLFFATSTSSFIRETATIAHASTLEAEAPVFYGPKRDLSITMCSCVKFARTLLPELPIINTPADLTPNTTPHVGVAVLFDYELPHIAILTALEPEGFWIVESNFKMCRKTTRFIKWADPALRGFWQPSP